MRVSKITAIFVQTVKNKLFIVSVCAAIAMVLGALSVGAMKYVFKPVAANPAPIEIEPASLATIQHQTELSTSDNMTSSDRQPIAPPAQIAQTPVHTPMAPIPSKAASHIPSPAAPLGKVSRHDVPVLHDAVAVDIAAASPDNPAHDTEPLLSLDSRILSLQVTNPLPVGGLSLGVHIP